MSKSFASPSTNTTPFGNYKESIRIVQSTAFILTRRTAFNCCILTSHIRPISNQPFVVLASHNDDNMAPIALNETTANANGTPNKPTTEQLKTSKYHASSSDEAIHAEHAYAAHNYHPLPIVFAKAQGTKVWDPEGREYLDFLSAYSAVNQGHCHPELVKALVDQASTLTLSSRAFYNDVFPRFAEFVTKYFNFDMVLPMNTGAEAVETAIKIARKWGYKTKGIPQDQAIVLSVAENFHGRTVSIPRPAFL